MIRNKSKFLTINQFALLCRSTSRTVRLYDQKGLLRPTKIDTQTGYRYYLPEQVRDFLKIKLFQTFDIPLSDIKHALRKTSQKNFLNKEIEKVALDINEKKKKYDFLLRVNSFLNDGDSPDKFIKIEKIPEMTIFGIRKEKISFSNLKEVINAIYKEAEKQKISLSSNIILRYLQPETYQPKDANVEVAVVCEKNIYPLNLPNQYFIRVIPSMRVLSCIYQGPYEYLTFIHQKLFYSEYFKKFQFTDYPFDLEFKPLSDSQYDKVTKIIYPIK